MFEIKMTIEIPGLPEALNTLASAINGRSEFICHQYGGNNHHIDNAGIVTFDTAAPKPVDAPVTPAANPTTAQAPAQNAPTTPTVAPTPAPAPVQTTAAPTAPASPGESYTLEALSRAGAALIDAGKMPQLLALLGKYGVQAVTQLPKEAYSAFAAELKALGAQL